MDSTSPQLAAAALETGPDAMLVVDSDWTIRVANRQVTAILGYASDEVLGRDIECLVPERFRERHIAHRNAYMTQMRVQSIGLDRDLYALRRDGTEVPIEIGLSPIENNGEVLAVVSIRDATYRRSVEAALNAQLKDMHCLCEMSRRLLEATEVPKMLEELLDTVIDLQTADFGNIQLLDSETGVLRIAAHLGFSQHFLDCFASVDSRDDSACGRALRAGTRVIIEDVETDGEYLSFRAVAAQEGYRAAQSTPIRGHDGVLLGMLSTHFRQPHRPSEKELQLTDLYMHLAARLIERGRANEAVQAARQRADRANESKSRFLATASHDLRQPLQALALLNGALRRTVRDEDAVQALYQQEQAIGAMSRLLNALLDISKLESGAVKPEPTDFSVATLFEELRREFASIAASKGLRLDVQTAPVCVRSDPLLIEQVLRNLIANAVKFTRRGRVALSCFAVANSKVRIEVLDTGIGIAPEHLSRIYDEFYQVDVAPNRSHNGYGLGLSIVKRLVRLLELDLEVRSEAGSGSSFSILLPPARSPATADYSGTGPRTASRVSSARRGRTRVILVEDDAAVRDATRLLLRSEGYQVTAVTSLQTALDAARNGVDLLVTDYHLGDTETGLQVITALREALSRPLKAILITGDTSAAIRELPRDPNLRVASKPITAEVLFTMMRELLADDASQPS